MHAERLPSGWRFVKRTSNDLWDIFAPEDDYSSSQGQWTPKRKTEQPKRESLSAESRDRQYRTIAKLSGLSSVHRADIEQRYMKAGLDPRLVQRLVDQRILFSWQEGEEFPRVTSNLPGTDSQGRLLRFGGATWAIGIPSVEGQIQGFQIKHQSGGYRWASSQRGSSVTLPNRENPIGVYRPTEQKFNRIGLAEGFLKPAIAAERLGHPFIGAAGGNFAGSPQQFKAAVEALSRDESIEIVLYPDGGGIKARSRNVHSAWRAIAGLCKVFGYSLKVAWWGQVEKGGTDVDEAPLAAIQDARLISADELLSMVVGAGDNSSEDKQISREDWLRLKQSTKAKPNFVNQTAVKFARLIDPSLPGRSTRRRFQRFKSQELKRQCAVSKKPFSTEKPCTALARLEDLATPTLLINSPSEIPAPESWEKMGRPEMVWTDRCDRESIWTQLIILGYRDILDMGATGDGKSLAAGRFLSDWGSLKSKALWGLFRRDYGDDTVSSLVEMAHEESGIPEELKAYKATYFSGHYRKPSTLELEQLPEAVIGGGLMHEPESPLPSGAPSTRRAKAGETPDIDPLCIEDNNIQRLRAKGIDATRGKDSPICNNCRIFQSEDGCPYLKALSEQKDLMVKRSHLSKGSSGAVAIVDEATRSITTERDCSATREDLEKELGRIAADPLAPPVLTEVAKVIARGLTYAMDERGLYGIGSEGLKAFLPTTEDLAPVLEQAEEAIRLQRIERDGIILDPWETPSATVGNELNRIAHHDLTKALEGQESPESKEASINGLIQAGVIRRVIQSICKNYGALEVDRAGKLKVTWGTRREVNTLNHFNTRIYLDATPNTTALAQQLRVPESQILKIRPLNIADYSNLTVRIIECVGSCGRQREKGGEYALRSRLGILAAHLVSNSADPSRTGIIDNKFYINDYEALSTTFGTKLGWNWVDNQNTNRFANCLEMIAINPKPMINLNSAASIWKVRTGSGHRSQAAIAHLDRIGQAHLIQECGRLRAQRRREKLTLNLVSDKITTADVVAIAAAHPGCTIERVNIVEICLEAAPRQIQAHRKMLNAMKGYFQNGESVSRNQLAKDLGCSPANITKMANHYGDYRGLLTLYEGLYRVSNPPELSFEQEVVLQAIGKALPEVLDLYEAGRISPEEAVTEVKELLEDSEEAALWLSDALLERIYLLLLQAAPFEAFSLAKAEFAAGITPEACAIRVSHTSQMVE